MINRPVIIIKKSSFLASAARAKINAPKPAPAKMAVGTTSRAVELLRAPKKYNVIVYIDTVKIVRINAEKKTVPGKEFLERRERPLLTINLITPLAGRFRDDEISKNYK